jgi:parallel beta helix pectate lyase-like protein
MRHRAFATSCSLLVGLAVLVPVLAQAQAARVFVSARRGNDASPCSLGAPCRTFQAAVNAVATSGEVIVLDSGEYGHVNITKSVSLIAPGGVLAEIDAEPDRRAIEIFGSFSNRVTLRGLTLNGGGLAEDGIEWSGGTSLDLQDVTIRGFRFDGIFFFGDGRLSAQDTIIRDNAGSGIVASGDSRATVSLDRVRLVNNGVGLYLVDRVAASVKNSVIAGNRRVGARVLPLNSSAQLEVEHCFVAHNGNGVPAGEGAGILAGSGFGGGGSGLARVAASVIVDNAAGIKQVSPGVLLSRGDNTVEGNGTDTSGAIGTYTPR